MKKLSFCLLPIFLVINGCSSNLSVSGSNVRVIDDASKYDCTFVTTLSAFDTFSPTTSAEQRSAVYKLRDQASTINANALVISSMVTTLGGSTANGNAYSCRFNDKKREEPTRAYSNAFIENTQQKAEAGDPEMQFALGVLYYDGHLGQQNKREAFKWILKSASQGYSLAQAKVSDMYYQGEGVTKNSSIAFNWMEKSALAGYDKAQGLVGLKYFFGHGVKKNLSQYIQWTRLAAQNGQALAQGSLGLAYASGEDGVPENYLKAYVWMSMSSSQGHELIRPKFSRLKSLMTKEQIQTGQKLAERCFESNYKECD